MRNKRLHTGFYIAGITAIFFILESLAWLQPLEQLSYDWRVQTSRQGKPAPPQIAVVLIDEASMQYMDEDIGRWPWPRSVHGDLLAYLSLGGAKAVVFDILFTEKEKNTHGNEPAAGDQNLAIAAARSKRAYFAAHFWKDSGERKQRQYELSAPLPPDYIRRYALNHEYSLADPNYNQAQIAFDPLYRSARGMGVVSVEPDSDGVYRRARLLFPYRGQWYPSLSVAPLLDYLGSGQPRMTPKRPQSGLLQWGFREIPVDGEGRYLINYYDRFETFSYAGLISSLKQIRLGNVKDLTVHPREFKNKIVFVGSNAVGLHDLKTTPLGANKPGVFLHAAIAGNILTSDFLSTPPRWAAYGGIFSLVTLVMLSMLMIDHTTTRILLTPSWLLIYPAVCFWAMGQNLVLPLTTPMLAGAAAWFGALIYLFFTEGKDKRKLRRMLSQYVSPAVMIQVMDNYTDHLQAEVGREELVSVLFSDIRDFTTISESAQATSVVSFLNRYFSIMNDVIFNHGGTIDKFIGDAIMAFWGAPVREPDHAVLAVRAAIAMLQSLPQVNEQIRPLGFNPLRIGIGINTGQVVIGNVGSEKKLDYTVIGDNVNLASRLEGMSKQYDCPIVISEFTYRQINQRIPCRPIDLVRVKGKQFPIKIYAPLAAEYDEHSAHISHTAELAFDFYLNRVWNRALECCGQLPNDKATALLKMRCQAYQKSEPSPEWDGAQTMTAK